jgi:hypothetical protein
MLDFAFVFTTGGLVLWERTFVQLRGSPLNDFIRDVLIEERSAADGSHLLDAYMLQWTVSNERGLVFLVCLICILQLLYIILTGWVSQNAVTQLCQRFVTGNEAGISEFVWHIDDLRQCTGLRSIGYAGIPRYI